MLDYRQIGQELETVRDYIRFGMSILSRQPLYFGHGTDNAFDEALAIVLYVITCPHEKLPMVLDARLTGKEKNQVLAILQKRIEQRLPLPYITNEAYFCGLKFYVDETVLIPRSPLAELIENQFSPWLDVDKTKHILELCTGSGCIAVALAYAFEEAKVVASDISEPALKVAQKNITDHGVGEQVSLCQSDIFQAIPKEAYDLIVSNPPYVGDKEMLNLPAEYHHEPRLALEARGNGLALVEEILAKAKDYLNDEGALVVEVGNSEEALIEKYPQVPFTWLHFERGGEGVFLLTKAQLQENFNHVR